MGNTLAPAANLETPPAERKRLLEADDPNGGYNAGEKKWRFWGCYTSDRQWGTVREDYSPEGHAWSWFTHTDAQFRAYRWGEDALLGYSDENQRLNFSLAMWNGKDSIMKERLWGLTNDEGPHGEDVKEVYSFEDATPTASYMAAKYRYPMNTFPYEDLVQRNRKLRSELYETGKHVKEYELVDTGIFDQGQFWDVNIEYAKDSEDPNDTMIRITVENCSSERQEINLLPSLAFRNTWSWENPEKSVKKPNMRVATDLPMPPNSVAVSCDPTEMLETPMSLLVNSIENPSQLLFCDNETNMAHFEGRSICRALYKTPNSSDYPKNGICRAVCDGDKDGCNPDQVGSKCAAHLKLNIPARGKQVVLLRLLPTEKAKTLVATSTFNEEVFVQRKKEADEFYDWLFPASTSDDRKSIQRRALAGMLWTRQTYIYDVNEWLAVGPEDRLREGARNRDWSHLHIENVLSVCDGWEYPWHATWDLAFHLILYAWLDPSFAKEQCLLLLKPGIVGLNGAPPAYEWAFSDFNPPLLAWGCLKIYEIEQAVYRVHDKDFLRNAFPRLDRMYQWFILDTSVDGHMTLGKSFLGLDNISITNRSSTPDTVEDLFQVDGTSWAAFTAQKMMKIALELNEPGYDEIASQLFINSAYRGLALNNWTDGLPRPGYDRPMLYDTESDWYYDVIKLKDSGMHRLACKTLVGIIPLYGVETFEDVTVADRVDFQKNLVDFISNDRREKILSNVMTLEKSDVVGEESEQQEVPFGLFLVDQDKLRAILRTVLDPNEFLSEYGIRSASKALGKKPFYFDAGEGEKKYDYQPCESYGDGKLFGGNSSWRGAIWFPTTYLLIEALVKYHTLLGPTWKIECPTGSGDLMNLKEVAAEIAKRMIRIFERRDEGGTRPSHGSADCRWNKDPRWNSNPGFYEYFHGETGAGLGASHQTGWTGLCADMIARLAILDSTR